MEGSTLPQTKTKTINIADVVAKVDLVTLAWEYGLDLIPQNNGDYVCLCPFHTDCETPSMRIYVQTNTFHCFGCGAGSSIFEFVMRMDDIDFKAALNKLAERAGYTTGTITFRDLNIHYVDDKFITVREKIELELLYKVKEVYRHLRAVGVPLKTLYDNFEALWEWYDKNQYIFDKKLFEGNNIEVLIVKLYEFHEAFLKKLLEVEALCRKT